MANMRMIGMGGVECKGGGGGGGLLTYRPIMVGLAHLVSKRVLCTLV